MSFAEGPVGVAGAMLVGDDDTDSRSIDLGRRRLLLRHPGLPPAWISFGLEPSFDSFVGDCDSSASAAGLGWSSERSPIMAISPVSGAADLPLSLGESLDQKAHVEPVRGAGSGFGGVGGVSAVVTFFEAASGASSGVGSGACVGTASGVDVGVKVGAGPGWGSGGDWLVLVAWFWEFQNPNHDVVGAFFERDGVGCSGDAVSDGVMSCEGIFGGSGFVGVLG